MLNIDIIASIGCPIRGDAKILIYAKHSTLQAQTASLFDIDNGEIRFDPLQDYASHLIVNGHGSGEAVEPSLADASVPHEGVVELPILLPARRVFGKDQIVEIEAQSGRASGVRVRQPHKALFPAIRQNGGVRTDAVTVITMRVVKRRKLADGRVDLFGPFGMIARINVRVVRLKDNRR